MRTRHIVIFVTAVVLFLASGIVYHVRYGRHTSFMGNFLFSKDADGQKTTGTRSAAQSGQPEPYALRYVDKVAPDVTDFVNSADFRQAPLDLRRMKLLEFFMLHVADTDYMLLPDAEKQRILDLFLKRYLVP